MNSKQREHYIFNQLLQHESIILDKLFMVLNVSKRTVYNDFKNLRDTLKNDHAIDLIKVGSSYSISEEDKQWLNTYNVVDELQLRNLQNERTFEIIKFILRNPLTTLQDISDHLYYSRSLIHQEMKEVERLFVKFNMQLVKRPYHGMSLVATENNIRLLIQYMVQHQLSSVDISIESIIKSNQLFQTEFNIVVEQLYSKYHELLNIDFIIAVYIMYLRVRKDKYFVCSERVKKMFDTTDQLEYIRSMTKDLCHALKIKYVEDEIYYLLINLDEAIYGIDDPFNATEIISEIEKLIKEKYSVHNYILASNLYIHIASMLKRINIGRIISNTILLQTKEYMPFAFSISADIAIMLESKFKVPMNEEEIGLLSMHIQVIINNELDEQTSKIPTLVVSHAGIGNLVLLSDQISRQFSQLKVVNRLTLRQMNQLIKEGKINNNMVIISTTKLAIKNTDYAIVSPILNDSDFNKIETLISNLQTLSSEKEIHDSVFGHLKTDYIHLQSTFASKEELLAEVCKQFVEDKRVTSEFYDSVIKREKLSTTYSINNVALPHGFSSFVNETTVALVLLKDPINWDGYYVKTVFVCALTLNLNNGENTIVKQLYQLINDNEILNKIHLTETKEDVVKAIEFYLKENYD